MIVIKDVILKNVAKGCMLIYHKIWILFPNSITQKGMIIMLNNNKCPICTKELDKPYRRYYEGKIIEGCIDKCHDKYLAKFSNSYNWVKTCRKNNK